MGKLKSKPICTRKFYFHGSKEYGWETFEEMEEEGLFDLWSDKEKCDFRDNFIYAFYEFEIEAEIYRDGTTKMISVDGKKVYDRPKNKMLFK